MKLCEFLDSKKDIDEKILLIGIIGALVSLKNRSITIDEAESFIFSPRNTRFLTNLNCDAAIVDLIENGCLLENFESLIPDKLDPEIDHMIEEALSLLKNYPQYTREHWVKGLDIIQK